MRKAGFPKMIGTAGRWLKVLMPWAILAGAIALALGALGRPKAPELAADFASWWQAIFSVAAILAAVLLSNTQHRRERELERLRALQANYDQVRKVAEVLAYARDLAEQLPHVGESRENNLMRSVKSDYSGLIRVTSALKAFGPQDVPHGTAFILVLRSIGDLEVITGVGGLSHQYLNAARDLSWHVALNPLEEARTRLRFASASSAEEAEEFRVQHGLAH